MLKVRVDDYGPLISGEVELKPLTIFVGPSNSGKSYMATAVYSLMNAVRESPASPFQSLHAPFGSEIRPRMTGWSLEPLSLEPDGSVPSAVFEALDAWAAQIDDDSDISLSSSPTFLKRIIDSALEIAIDGIGESLSHELVKNYGELSDLGRTSANSRGLQIRMQCSEPLLSTVFNLGSTGVGFEVAARDFDASNAQMDGNHIKSIVENRSRVISPGQSGLAPWHTLHGLFNHAIVCSYMEVFGSLPLNIYYLPASRSGITHGQKAIAGTLVRQAQYAGLNPVEIPTLPGVIRDFISHMLTMQPRLRDDRIYRPEPTSALAHATAFLENTVVHGIVDLEQDGDMRYPEIYFSPNDGSGRFPFHRTSSMVSELAPLVLLLKHSVREGHFIILEEPESHLHPASQRQMARAVVRLVNAGVQVLLTTHSDLFLSALNNLVRLNAVKSGELDQLGLSAEDRLNPDDVAAYQFAIDGQQYGSRIRRLDIRSDIGIDENEFSSVVEQLYDESVVLQRIRTD